MKILFFAVLIILSVYVPRSGAEIITINTDNCTECHGVDAWNQIHRDVDHIANLAAGTVVLFPDFTHDDAAWGQPSPQFEVTVDCATCHGNHLPTIHGNNCSRCHPSPYDSLGNDWQRGCQQGGCHQTPFHEDSTTAHLAFEDPYDPDNDCELCHVQATWEVPQNNCLNCHADSEAGDTTPPVTNTNIQDGSTYVGPIKIDFRATDNGKVGVVTTYYRLDTGVVTIGSSLFVAAVGNHELYFWSEDQAGNVEATKLVTFTINADTEPPITTSNAQNGATYYNGASFTLSAVDNGTLGVKNTYFRINSGPVQTGTSVVIPNTFGTFTYTLIYWSEDWSGNIETERSVTFTVKSGPGTLRLVWWDSDMNPAHAPDCDYGDYASWTVRRGGWGGPVVATGSGDACLGWDGIDDISVPISTTGYYVRIDWESGGYTDQTDFPNIIVDDPGEVITLYY